MKPLPYMMTALAIWALLMGSFFAIQYEHINTVASETYTASIFSKILSPISSLFEKIGSAISNTKHKSPAPPPKEIPSQISCTPPVSPKPSTEQHALGTMTITPEISQENKDNVITVSLVSRIDSLTVQLGSDPLSPYRWQTFSRGSIVDWGPKPAELPQGGKGVNITMSDNSITWETHEYINDNRMTQPRPRLPAQTYWVKLKANQTTPWESDENIGSYGWKEIQYNIHYVEGAGLRTEDFKTVSGKSMYYVGGPQYPTGAIARVGGNGKSVTVKAGQPFEIEAKPTGWQGGTMTINTGNTAHVIGPSQITVKAGESAVWKVLPRGTYPVKGSVKIENECNNVFSSQFPSRVLNPSVGSFETPITFDFTGVSKEKMRLAFQGGPTVLDFTKAQSSFTLIPWLSLMDGQVVVAPAPNQKLTIQAMYKDNPQEIAKSILITPEGEAQETGSASTTTGKEGTARLKIRAPRTTKEEVSRGILLKVSAPGIEGLTSEVQILFTGVVIDVPTPETNKTPVPTPQPVPPKQSTNVSPHNLIVSANTPLGELTEGDRVTFTAMFVMSDGSTEITNNVTWAVLGQIGNITSQGVFTAKLDNSISEYGEGYGIVTATYEDTADNSFLGQSNVIKVKMFIPEQTETEG